MWTSTLSALCVQPPLKYSEWMERPYQLAPALRRVCQELSVDVLNQDWGPSYPDEYTLLGLFPPPIIETCYIREVFLKGDQIPFCYARVVILPSVYIRYETVLTQLGQRLIGETLLYYSKGTVRSPFEYGCLSFQDALFKRLYKVLPDPWANEKNYWGRRSVFYLQGCYPILVVEIFIPAIPGFKNER